MPATIQRACPVFGCAPPCQHGQRPRVEKTSQARGYNQRWREYSERFRKLHPFCGERVDGKLYSEHSFCVAEGRATRSRVVDHIVPVRSPQDPKFWDRANHQGLCAQCHNRKTVTEDGGFVDRRVHGERIIVTGAPGSGKTTWVMQRARPGDLVFDLDSVANTVANLPVFPRPIHVMRALLAMREGLVQWLEKNQVVVHVFLIVTDEDEARRIAARVQGRVVWPHTHHSIVRDKSDASSDLNSDSQ